LLIIEENILPEHVQEIVSKARYYHSENIEKKQSILKCKLRIEKMNLIQLLKPKMKPYQL
jgi:hypothetical protein